eukprot:13532217-Ditylum_brightwellii.AAC.1
MIPAHNFIISKKFFLRKKSENFITSKHISKRQMHGTVYIASAQNWFRVMTVTLAVSLAATLL